MKAIHFQIDNTTALSYFVKMGWGGEVGWGGGGGAKISIYRINLRNYVKPPDSATSINNK